MMRIITTIFAIVLANSLLAKTIVVKNAEELAKANQSAQPGDTIIFQDGIWNNIEIKLNCSGTKEKPILLKAQNPGKVIISGTSQLKIGGNYIVINGLLFTNGYSPSRTVIDFRINNKELANNCRVTNCVINDFNKPKRVSDDVWISLSGKNNRVDHCSFLNKKNMGTLVAVILDDERSRENFHSIDHNYFGIRPVLASNGGEIIRVGLSQHCQFNSNTLIKDNFFEHCDGETEIISIKSGSNIVSNNVFKECQGSVVLRHGDNNTVTNNFFLGNGKEATGGVRIINRGQWVINNFFYKCRGESFRAPISIMNGIPNSPANRYVQVTDAVIMKNTFVDCTPMSLCEGSDEERTLAPSNVLFAKNIFYNNKDSFVYEAWDDISGIRFYENEISEHFAQSLARGFERISFQIAKVGVMPVPSVTSKKDWVSFDSLTNLNKERLPVVTAAPGFTNINLIKKLEANAYKNCGAKWFVQNKPVIKSKMISCKTAEEVYAQIENQKIPLIIQLTGSIYSFDKLILINNSVEFTSTTNNIQLSSDELLPALFVIKGKGILKFSNLKLSLEDLHAQSFIATDTTGSPEHYSLIMKKVSIKDCNSCPALFYAHRSTLADSILVQNCIFNNISNGFLLADENDDKGYYNVEKIKILNNQFADGNGILLDLYRGGSDESTLGPDLLFANNQIKNYNSVNSNPLIRLTGVQKTKISGNRFDNSNASGTLILYNDKVRASHYLGYNTFIHSGSLQTNNFVTEEKNSF